jgi:hypothetical protein
MQMSKTPTERARLRFAGVAKITGKMRFFIDNGRGDGIILGIYVQGAHGAFIFHCLRKGSKGKA